MKHFACGSVVAGCQHEFQAADEDGILSQVAAHAHREHDVPEVGPELVEAVRSNISTVAA